MGTGSAGLTLQVLWKHRFSHAGMYFYGCAVGSFTALTHPGMSVGRLGLCRLAQQ